MTPKLRNLLLASGVVVLGGVTALILVPKPGTGRAAFVDAGLLGCPMARVACPVRNICPKEGPRYGTREACARDCRTEDGGGGLIWRWPRNDAGRDCIEVLGPCEFLDGGAGDTFCDDDGGQGSFFPSRIIADTCVCATAAGPCYVAAPDGGTVEAEHGITYPGGWGVGCEPKPCREAAGELGQSWPQECPR